MNRPPTKIQASKGGPTPALRQFFEAKASCPEAILFFQMGDFYELFFEDAELVGPLLDLVLTSRQKVDGKPVPMCGVPLSAAEGYINRLVSMGHKVAVCDQLSSPGPGALAERVVKRIITPGTVVDSEGQSPNLPRFLASISRVSGDAALAAADLSTGSVLCGRFDSIDSLQSALAALEPKELLLSTDAEGDLKTLAAAFGAPVTERPADNFSPGEGKRLLRDVYGFDPDSPEKPPSQGDLSGLVSHSDLASRTNPASQTDLISQNEKPSSQNPSSSSEMEGGSLSPGALKFVFARPCLLSVMGALLGYLKEMARDSDLSHLSEPRLLAERGALGLDEAAVRNLELFKTLSGETSKATLLAQIDMTATPMGARMLRDWLARPLMNRKAIEGRHEAVEFLVGDLLSRKELTELLSEGGDLERALGRLALSRGAIRDLLSVKRALSAAPKIRSLLLSCPATRLKDLGRSMDLSEALLRRLEKVLDDAKTQFKDGQAVRSGVSPVLDELRDLESGGKMEIAAMETQEKRRTGISNLKIGFNKIFGYYLEVTKSNLGSVPSDWIRKQTIAGGERYVTETLKRWEEKVLTAGDKRQALETRIIENLKSATAREAPRLKALAGVLSEADVLASFAACAEAKGWTRPKLSTDDIIDIKGGRHPVVEKFLPPGEAFVENDVHIDHRERILIITGPNMAGKSTVLRQTALIVILCQMGSFVPAASATLSIRDQVFTRVGASDDLARGRSTFMVEMSETARILKKATPSSLVILDEVGRGTSTFDGLAIAWAVAERLHDLGGRGVATLFATHYHELVELSRHKSMVRNYNVSVKRWGDSILFLRKLAPGGVNRSYGLDVASLAGLPPQVVKRAREVLADIGRQGSGLIRPSQGRANLLTLAGIGQDGPQALAMEIASLKAEELTPMEAMNILVELKRRASEVLS